MLKTPAENCRCGAQIGPENEAEPNIPGAVQLVDPLARVSNRYLPTIRPRENVFIDPNLLTRTGHGRQIVPGICTPMLAQDNSPTIRPGFM